MTCTTMSYSPHFLLSEKYEIKRNGVSFSQLARNGYVMFIPFSLSEKYDIMGKKEVGFSHSARNGVHNISGCVIFTPFSLSEKYEIRKNGDGFSQLARNVIRKIPGHVMLIVTN